MPFVLGVTYNAVVYIKALWGLLNSLCLSLSRFLYCLIIITEPTQYTLRSVEKIKKGLLLWSALH